MAGVGRTAGGERLKSGVFSLPLRGVFQGFSQDIEDPVRHSGRQPPCFVREDRPGRDVPPGDGVISGIPAELALHRPKVLGGGVFHQRCHRNQVVADHRIRELRGQGSRFPDQRLLVGQVSLAALGQLPGLCKLLPERCNAERSVVSELTAQGTP